MIRGQPLASIIINNHNYGRFLGEAIESALAQTYTPLEVIVVDDGSTDHSRAVIASYGDRIRPVLKENGGQGSAFNAGFAASRGEAVLFLDSDDVLLPTAVERAVALLGEPGVVKVHWPLWKADAEGRPTSQRIPVDDLPEGDLRAAIFRDGPAVSLSAPTSGNAWARGFLERVLPMPEPEYRIGGDFYLYSLAPAFGVIEAVTTPLGLYRVHGRNNYLHMPLEERLRIGFGWYRCQHRVLEEYAREAGIRIDIENWHRQSYFHQLQAAIRDVQALVPVGDPLILADEARWGVGPDLYGRPVIPFTEQHGDYGGAPADDAMAIRELERLRTERGATHLAVAWPAFWWLEYYAGFAAHLRSAFPCVLENERLVVFRLQP